MCLALLYRSINQQWGTFKITLHTHQMLHHIFNSYLRQAIRACLCRFFQCTLMPCMDIFFLWETCEEWNDYLWHDMFPMSIILLMYWEIMSCQHLLSTESYHPRHLHTRWSMEMCMWGIIVPRHSYTFPVMSHSCDVVWEIMCCKHASLKISIQSSQ